MKIYRRHKRFVIAGGAVLLVLLIIGLILWLRPSKNSPVSSGQTSNNSVPASNTSSSQKQQVSGGSGNSGVNNNSSPNSSLGSGGPSSSSGSLIAPSGTFVSNHHPNLSGSPAPNQEQSVCNTSPGATCTISFTKDGVTKSLNSQKTDSNGTAYWSWTLQDLGLSEGSWQITAQATLGNQTQSATDSLTLQVSP